MSPLNQTGQLVLPLLPKQRKGADTGVPSDVESAEQETKDKNIGSNHGGEASFATSVFNLLNNLAGAGLLTLPSGKAGSGTGWIPSILICASMALASATTFILIGRACDMTGEKTFKGLWSQAFGGKRAYILDSLIFVHCFLISTIYIGLLADIINSFLPDIYHLSSLISQRTTIIAAMTSTMLFPLNLVRDLSSLRFTSMLGIFAVLYTVIFILFRAMDGSYSIKSNQIGRFMENDDIVRPSFSGSSVWHMDTKALILMCNVGLSFVAHYNAPTFWKEMKNVSPQSFGKMVKTSYCILLLIYVACMAAGYWTFGDSCEGNILLNYHSRDILATIGQFATVLSVLSSFPLVFSGAREGLKNATFALGYPFISSSAFHVPLVIIMLFVASMLSILLDDIKLIARLSGATMGSFLVYICPCLLYTKIVRNNFGEKSYMYKRESRYLLFVPFGMIMSTMGVIIIITSLNNVSSSD